MSSASRRRRESWLRLWLMVGVVFLANHLSSRHFVRLDLTADQVHSISPASTQVLSKLERPLVAKLIFTPELGAPYNNVEAQVLERLEAFRAYSNGQMEIQVLHPMGSKSDKEKAEQFGVSSIQYRFRDHDRLEMKSVYMGLALVYGDAQVAINPITGAKTLEYQLAAAIHSLTEGAESRKVVGYLQGNGEPDLAGFSGDNPLAKLYQRLSTRYEMRPVVLGADEGVPADVDAMLVVGPTIPVTTRSQYQLDQYLMGGGPIAMFLSSTRPDFKRYRADELNHGLHALVGHYGVTLSKDLLIDRSSNEQMSLPMDVGGRRRMVPLNYPLLPVTRAFSSVSPVSRGLDRAVLPFVSTVSLASTLPVGVYGDVWLSTEESAASLRGVMHIRPDVVSRAVPGEVVGAHPVAVGLTGSFESFFANRPVPMIPGLPSDDPRNRAQLQDRLLDGAPARLAVVGSADFIANNADYLLNTVDWMVKDPILMQIRSRDGKPATLSAPDESSIGMIRLLVGFGPLLLLLTGLGVRLARRRA